MWHSDSLGSLGETICLDAVGVHCRSQQTDLRVQLFAGVWANNTGGSEFLIYFNGTGNLVYAVAADVFIQSPGPCLSNTTLTQVSEDGAIAMRLFVSGARTDDFAKHFMHFRYDVLKTTTFSRCRAHEFIFLVLLRAQWG